MSVVTIPCYGIVECFIDDRHVDSSKLSPDCVADIMRPLYEAGQALCDDFSVRISRMIYVDMHPTLDLGLSDGDPETAFKQHVQSQFDKSLSKLEHLESNKQNVFVTINFVFGNRQ